MSPKKEFTGPRADNVKQLSGLDDAIRAFYDTFMTSVEPDLTTKNIQNVDEKYANETPEERKKRAQRYNHAYNLFVAAYTFSVQCWQSDLEYYYRQAQATGAAKAEAADRAKADDIAASL
jgi:hypothetical protein